MSESIELQENKARPRSASTYYDTDPQTALLISFTTGNLDKFQEILKHGRNIDIDHAYADHDSKTLLEIACCSENKSKFLQLLLEYGADVNLLNKVHGKAPIHWAILNSNYDALILLMENNTLINKPDNSGKTAIQLAAQQGKENLVQLLKRYLTTQLKAKNEIPANRASIHINVEEQPRMIANCFNPDLCKDYQIETEDRLFSLLEIGNYEAFIAEANSDNVNRDSNGHYTYLQYACKFGLSFIVRVLLDLDVDVNKTIPRNKMTPIILAAYYGYFDIVRMLVDTGRITYSTFYRISFLLALWVGGNSTLRPKIRTASKNKADDHDYFECLEYLFENIPRDQMDILLDQDKIRNSILCHAMFCDNRNVIRLLLERGTYIGAENSRGKVLIKDMKAATLKYFIDENLTYEGYVTNGDYKIILDYNLLVCKSTDEFFTETKSLVAISEVPQLRPLLNHPYFIAFSDLKWYMMMRKITIANYLFYLIFVLCLSSYLVIIYVPITTKLNSQNNTIYNNVEDLNYSDQKGKILWQVAVSLNVLLFCRELIYFFISFAENKYIYIKNIKHLIDLVLVVVTFVILFGEFQSAECRSLLTVTAIFLSWFELTLLIFRSHPSISVYLAMFNTVAWNTFKFLLCYLILIVAFALSFHILLKDSSNKEFKQISLSLFRTWIMSAGQNEVADTFGDHFCIRHFLFALFIFLIPIVLMNLSNGVAVSDIQRIRQEAEIVTAVARINSIARIEGMISDTLSFFCKITYYYRTLIKRHPKSETNRYCYALKQYFHRNCKYINLISTFSEDGKVYILPNRNNYVFMKEKCEKEQTGQSNTNRNTPKLFISSSTVEYIKQILNERFTTDEKKSTHDEITAVVIRAIAEWQQKAEDRFQILQQKTEDRLQIIEQKLGINNNTGPC